MAREVVLGRPGLPVPTGQMVYRVTLPVKTLRGIPEVEEIITMPRNNHWLGPNGTVLSYLLEGVNDTLINFVFTLVLEFFLGHDRADSLLQVGVKLRCRKVSIKDLGIWLV